MIFFLLIQPVDKEARVRASVEGFFIQAVQNTERVADIIDTQYPLIKICALFKKGEIIVIYIPDDLKLQKLEYELEDKLGLEAILDIHRLFDLI